MNHKSKLQHYLHLSYPIELVPDEGGFVATVPDLPGCMSSGSTAEEALRNLDDAKELWISGMLEDSQPIPEPTETSNYSGRFVLRIPRSLHRTLDRAARNEGVSLNQYIVHLLSAQSVHHEFSKVLSIVEELCSVGRAGEHFTWRTEIESMIGRCYGRIISKPETTSLGLLEYVPKPPSGKTTLVKRGG